LYSHLFEDVDELRRGLAPCVETCNNERLMESKDNRTPRTTSSDAMVATAT
jgi:hypothetical protein